MPTTVLIPGLTCDARFWAHSVDALDDRHVVVPDLRNESSLTDMAQIVLDATDGPLDVIGHSMGGRVAFEVIRLASERVRSLAVLDTGVHPVGPDEPATRQAFLDLAADGGMDAVADRWIPIMVPEGRLGDGELIGAIREMVTSHTVEQFNGQIAALLGRRDATPQLAGIAVPTLVATGRFDAWSPVAQHERIAEAIPGARLEIIEDAGHMVAMERPEATTTLLLDWLAAVAG